MAAALAALAVAGGAGAAPRPINGLAGEFPVLVILQCYKDLPAATTCGSSFTAATTAPGPAGPNNAWDYSPLTLSRPALYDAILFGPRPSVRDFFLEQSYGKFTVEKAGILPPPASKSTTSGGWYVAPGTEAYYWSGNHDERWADALKQADADFDFAPYDENGDGTVGVDELAIVIVVAHNRDWDAFVRRAAGSPVGTNDGVKLIGHIAEVYAFGSWFARIAHELGHLVNGPGNLGDLYVRDASGSYRIDAKQIQDYSLMGLDWRHPHLDPWNKWKVGWLKPKVVTSDGVYSLADSETNPDVYLLRDPCHGTWEYFLVENRWPGTSYDGPLPGAPGLPSAGIAIWHVDESRTEVQDVLALERAQNGVVREDAGDALALWRNSGPRTVTGYPFTDSSSPRNSRWNDGRHSRIAISDFSPAGPVMTVRFTTPEDEYRELADERDALRRDVELLELALAGLDEVGDLPRAARAALVQLRARLQEQLNEALAKLAPAEAALAAFCDVPSGPPPPPVGAAMSIDSR